MIDRAEVGDWARRLGVAPLQIRRDHFISHVLAGLGTLSLDARFFGGTALCRTYLVNTRLSEDIDLLHPEPREFLAVLRTQLPRALRREFPDMSSTDPSPEGDGLASFLTPTGSAPIKIYVGREGVDTAAWKFTETSVQLRYRDLPPTQALLCPTLPTFAAMKLAAWFDRHAPRDLFDLAGLAQLGALGDPEVDRRFRAKMGIGIVAAEFDDLPKSTADAWETELAAQVALLPPVGECLARVRDAITGGSAGPSAA